MYSNDRSTMRRVFADSWRKANEGSPLEPMERLIAEVVRLHPEYHGLLQSDADKLDRDYLPEGGETNPFLHMGMHITLQEQLGTDRPVGIRAAYSQLVQNIGDAHSAEHQMMECLGLALWEAQRAGGMPDEQAYLQCVRKLASPE